MRSNNWRTWRRNRRPWKMRRRRRKEGMKQAGR